MEPLSHLFEPLLHDDRNDPLLRRADIDQEVSAVGNRLSQSQQQFLNHFWHIFLAISYWHFISNPRVKEGLPFSWLQNIIKLSFDLIKVNWALKKSSQWGLNPRPLSNEPYVFPVGHEFSLSFCLDYNNCFIICPNKN